MDTKSEKPSELSQCSMDSDGIVTCSITKEKFNDIQSHNIKPKKIVFEIK